MQKEDFNYFVGGAWQKDGHHGGFTKADVRMLEDINLAGRLTLVDGDNKEIIPGIRVYTGSRHTFNSQFVGVNTGAKNIVLASDNIWIYYSLEHLVPASTGGTFDPVGFVKSMQRMKTLASDSKYIIPGHDARVFTLFPKVADGVVEIR
jgi:glyoxylase-like metal-dependent hydrolase (beta-lactamase superfamily II)